MMNLDIEKMLEKLSYSKFRSSFHLSKKLKEYTREKGMDTIRNHAKDFIRMRLSPYPTPKDGAQTPMKGHPVFIAQHATATCCRSCLEKWYHIPKNRELTEKEQEILVNIIITWIRKENK